MNKRHDAAKTSSSNPHRGGWPSRLRRRLAQRTGEWVVRLLPGGIRQRLFLLIVLAAVPMLILQVWIYYQRHDARRNLALQMESEVAQGIAMTFSAYIDGVHRHLDALGQTILTFSPYTDAKAQRVLEDATARFPSVRSMNWVSPKGRILVSNLADGVGRDLSIRPYFQQIQAGQSWAIGDLTEQGAIVDHPTVAMGAAVRDDDGRLLGVVVASLEPTRLGELTFPHRRHAGGVYVIIDRQGQLVYRNPPVPLTWEDRVRWRRDDPLLQRALDGQISEGVITSPIARERRIAARVPIAGIGWVAGAARPVDVVMGPARRALFQDVMLGLIVTSLALLLAALAARTIAEPLRRLEHDAQAMGAGVIEMPAGLQAPTEVHSLRGTVTAMAADLTGRAEALREAKDRLQEQTEELQTQTEELRAANDALQVREREYRTLAENTPEVIARFDRRLRHTYINEYGARVYGMSQREVIGKTAADLDMPADKVAFWEERFEQVFATGRQQTVEFEFDSPTFGHQYFSSLFVPEFDARGEVVSILVLTRDVTSVKLADQMLRQEKALSESTIESMPGIFYLFDSRGKFLKWNRNLGRVTGYAEEEVARMHPLDFFPGESKPLIEQAIQKVFTQGQASVEAELVSKDGRRTPHLFTGLMTTLDGIDCVIGTGLDISERKQAEEALRESEGRHRRLIENLKGSHFVYVHDTDGVFQYVSESITGILGYSPSEFMTHYATYLTDHPANEAARRHTELTIQGIRQPPYEVNTWHKDGSTRWLEVQEVPVLDEEGKVVAVEGVAQDITVRKRAEEALRESEERHRFLIESVNDWIWEVDRNGVYTYVSPQCREMLGYEPQEIVGKTPFDLMPPDEAERSRKAFVAMAGQARPFRRMENVNRRKDGRLVVLETNGVPVLDAQGKLAGYRGIDRDITERKRAEEALRESEQWFRTLANTTPQLVWTADPDGRVDYYNERYKEYRGIEPTPEGDFHWAPVLHPDDVAPTVEVWEHAVRTGETYQIEHRVQRADGSYHWHLSRGMPVRDSEGRIVKWFGTATDIDDLKRAEEALRQSESFYRQTLESIPGMVFTTRPDGYCDYQSQQWVDYTGVPVREHLGSGWIQLLHPEDRPRASAAWRNAVAGRAPYDLDYRVRRRDGEYEWFKVIGRPIRDAEGRIVRWFGAAINIEAIKQAQEGLRRLTETLESKVAQRTVELEYRARQLQKLTLELSQAEDRERRRLADILHDDLQQQLAAVKFHLGLLSNRTRHDAALHKMAAQLDRMLTDAVETSRNLSHELSPAMLYQGTLGETFEWLANQIRTKHGLDVHVRADDEINLESDALKAFLYKAAQEMLFNVVKHARVGQARVRVRRLGGCICLIVSDRGRGFDPQDLKAATGFGLFSIRERVQLLGGRMRIKSAPGKGSTFFIAVPDGAEKIVGVGPRAYPASVMPGDRGEKEGGHGGPPLRVLVADDHEIVRQGLAALLREQEDIQFVGEAANGREAVDLASRLRPDVVIMDVAMPLMNGDEATRQTKMHLPETRVIALSMYAEDSMIEKMRQAGADCYILKTAPADELLAAVRGKKVCA